MRLTVQIADGSRRVDLDVQVREGATLGDLLDVWPAGARALPENTPDAGMPGEPGDGIQARVDEIVLPRTALLGHPPLLQGTVVTLARTRAGQAEPGQPGLGHGSPRALGLPSARRAALLGLQVVGGPDVGALHDLPPGRHLIGRDVDCPLHVTDPAMSRRHALIHVTSDSVTVRDLGSTNGSWLDGRPLTAAAGLMTEGTRLRLGETTVVLAKPELPSATIRGDGQGYLVVSRAPRQPPWQPGPPITFPEKPGEDQRRRIPWAAVLLPLVFSGVLAFVTKSATMLMFGLMSPLVLVGSWWADRRTGRRTSAADRVRYAAALTAAHRALDEAVAAESRARKTADPGPAWLAEVARHRLAALWDRTGPGSLLVRVGVGSMAADVSAPGWPHEPLLQDVPVTVDLVGCTGVAGPRDAALGSLRAIVGGLAVRHSPARVAIRLDPEAPQSDWGWLTLLPHYLPGWPESTSATETATALAAAAPDRDVVVITEDAERVAPSERVHVLAIADRVTALPPDTTTVLDLSGSSPTLTRPSGGPVKQLTVDTVNARWAGQLAQWLRPLRDAASSAAHGGIPESVGLLSLLGLPRTDQHLDVASAWTQRPRTTSFPIGMGAAGPVWLDLVRDGPHGLVGGTTGSGKSELLVSVVAGLAAGNRPDELSFVLVDYKGGAAFGVCRDLPHVVGLVTDLDPQLTERALISLDAELKRRERVFAARGVGDLAAYQRIRGVDDERVGRIVIVVDEFRSLAEELPDFVDGLVRVASVGRSLGVHLLVATQRPGGVVTPDMRTNLGLRVALRVRDAVDSLDVLESPVAAKIGEHTPGRAFVSSSATGLTEVQSPLATGPATIAETPAVTVLSINGVGLPRPGHLAGRSELDELVAATSRATAELGIRPPDSPWLAPLPALLTLDALPPSTPPVVGRCDEPALQRQRDWTWDPFGEGNLGIVGGPRSGRTSTLQTICAALARAYSPDELHVYAVHTGALLGIDDLPHLGASVPVSDLPRLARLLAELTKPTSPTRAPRILLVDDWERVIESLERARSATTADQLLALARTGADARLTLAVSGGRGLLSGQVASSLTRRIVLLPADQVDLTLLGVPSSSVPANPPPGRAIDATSHLEVQLAALLPDPTPTRRAEALVELGQRSAAGHDGSAVPIPVLPHRISRAEAPEPVAALPECLPVATDGIRVVGFRPGSGERRIAALGSRGSGRTTALATVAAALLDQDRTVAVIRGAPGPHPTIWPESSHVLTIDDVEELIKLRQARSDLALIIDDAARLTGTEIEPVVREILRLVDEDAGVIAVGGTPSQVGESYRSVLAEIAGGGVGLLLGALNYGEEQALGVRRPIVTEDIPGRGYLVRRAAATAVHVFS